MKNQPAEWRELELLVKKIEQTLASDNAIIKSPDMILDRVTQELREVDVSVRLAVGSTTVLILIECRNRTGAQDVRSMPLT